MNNRGMALVTVLMLVSVLLILIASLLSNGITNISIFSNNKSSKIDFYIADSANKIEISDIITISVSNITTPSEPPIKDSSLSLSDTSSSYTYHSTIKFEFYKSSITPGTSLNMFSNYYYNVTTTAGDATIKTLSYKIGPKM